MTAWLLLVAAGVLEIAWVLGMKYSEGFTRPVISILTVIAIVASVLLLERAARDLPVGTAYAVWGAIGTMGTAIFAMIFLHEPLTALRAAGIVLIIAGVTALKVA